LNGGGNGKSYLLLLTTASLGTILAPLNSTMLAVALPEIREEFAVGHAAVAWLVSAYLIAMAVAQPIGGRLGDQLGRARVMRMGLLMFLALSLAAAVAPNFIALIVFRTGQALVGAAVIPNGMAMLRESLPSDRLGRANGITGSVIALSAAVGPLLGSVALVAGSWRFLFLVNVPFVAAALLSLALLSYRAEARRTGALLDWRGAILIATLLAALTQGFTWTRSGPAALAVLAFVLVALAAWLLVRSQSRATVQVAEWRLLRHRPYFGATAYILLTNLVMYTTLLAIPFFLKEVQAKPTETAGLLLGLMSGLMMVSAPVAGHLSDARGRRPLALAGGLLQLTGILLLVGALSEGLATWYIGLCLAFLGAGVGIGTGPANTAAIESAPIELAGSAAGTTSMMRYFGSIVGVGVLGAVLTTDGAVPSVAVFRGLLAFLAVLSVAALLAASLIHVRLKSEAEPTLVTLDGKAPMEPPGRASSEADVALGDLRAASNPLSILSIRVASNHSRS
jgi:MFS family permease